MKRYMALPALVLALLLCGCGKETADLALTNNLTVTLHNIYLSPMESDDWGESAVTEAVPAGETVELNFPARDEEEGEAEGAAVYDFGAIDENALNYDIYTIPLTAGDILSLTAEGGVPTLTVTHADETSDVYEGFTYTDSGD